MIEMIREFGRRMTTYDAMRIDGGDARELMKEFDVLESKIKELTSQLQCAEDETLMWKKKYVDELDKRLALNEQVIDYWQHKNWDACSEQEKFDATSTGNVPMDAGYKLVNTGYRDQSVTVDTDCIMINRNGDETYSASFFVDGETKAFIEVPRAKISIEALPECVKEESGCTII